MDDPQDLGRLLACCGHLGRQYGVNLLRRKGYDVTPVQTRTLVYLSCCREAVNQRELERELRLRPSTRVSRIMPSPQNCSSRLYSVPEPTLTRPWVMAGTRSRMSMPQHSSRRHSRT